MTLAGVAGSCVEGCSFFAALLIRIRVHVRPRPAWCNRRRISEWPGRFGRVQTSEGRHGALHIVPLDEEPEAYALEEAEEEAALPSLPYLQENYAAAPPIALPPLTRLAVRVERDTLYVKIV